MAKSKGCVTLVCHECGAKFQRRAAQHARNKKLGIKQTFCGCKCRGRYGLNHYYKPRSEWKKTGKKLDELSPYRCTMSRIRKRKKWDCDIDVEYIRDLFQAQRGLCAISGLKLGKLPAHTNENTGGRTAYTPSLDRIDSTKGYVRGNVQWVTTLVNLAKSNFPLDDLITTCKAVTDQYASRTESSI